MRMAKSSVTYMSGRFRPGLQVDRFHSALVVSMIDIVDAKGLARRIQIFRKIPGAVIAVQILSPT